MESRLGKEKQKKNIKWTLHKPNLSSYSNLEVSSFR